MISLGWIEKLDDHDRREALSKVGGKPDWLVGGKGHLPSPEELKCSKCGNIMRFLLQVNAPRQQSQRHRMLYIFSCATCGRDLRVLRCQISDESLGEHALDAPDITFTQEIQPYCCQHCGLPSLSPHLRCINAFKDNDHSQTYPEYVVNDEQEEEENDSPYILQDIDHRALLWAQKIKVSDTQIIDQEFDVNDQDDDGDEDKEDDHPIQDFIPEEDAVLDNYIQYMHSHPPHILRYGAESPLWFSYKGQLQHFPPNCDYCGAPRAFEFQIQSTLLDALHQNHNLELSFGILAIYTCSMDCIASDTSYMHEFIHKQRDPTLDLAKLKCVL